MTFTDYKDDPKVGTRSYRGINLTVNQLFITSVTAKEFIKKYTATLVAYDKDKKAIRLRLTKAKYDSGLPIRRGLSYAHYIPCRLATQAGMPTGRYYVESHNRAQDKSGDYEIIFKHAPKK